MKPAEKYILSQNEPFKQILIELQLLIEVCVPKVELKYKYNCPFYYYNQKPFCYLNVSKNYVDLGLVKGAILKESIQFLNTEKRKQVASLRYYLPSDIDENIVRLVLQEQKKLFF